MLSEVTTANLHEVYDRVDSSIEEFEEDLRRIAAVSRMVRRYSRGGELNVRQVVNQIVILNNVFGQAAFIAIEEDLGPKYRIYIDTILVWLGRYANRVIDPSLYSLLEKAI